MHFDIALERMAIHFDHRIPEIRTACFGGFPRVDNLQCMPGFRFQLTA